MKKADVNIEFAHTDFAVPLEDPRSERDICISGELASKQLVAHQTMGLECTTSVLIDDKNCERPPTFDDVNHFLSMVALYGPPVDFVCFESMLPEYEAALVKSLRPPERLGAQTEIERYKRSHGGLGCSHDIAIWHLLRLGILGPVHPKSVTAISILASKRIKPFFARKVVSVIPTQYRQYEDRAQRDILNLCEEEGIARQIELIYF